GHRAQRLQVRRRAARDPRPHPPPPQHPATGTAQHLLPQPRRKRLPPKVVGVGFPRRVANPHRTMTPHLRHQAPRPQRLHQRQRRLPPRLPQRHPRYNSTHDHHSQRRTKRDRQDERPPGETHHPEETRPHHRAHGRRTTHRPRSPLRRTRPRHRSTPTTRHPLHLRPRRSEEHTAELQSRENL